MFDEYFNLIIAILLILMGVYMLIITRFLPLRPIKVAKGMIAALKPKGKKSEGEISGFEALAAALGGSVGTGNIAGVASAIAIGGEGAIFWMWVSGILGMATKYAEVLIAMRYRKKENNTYTGGTMYCITKGMGNGAKPLAVAFAVFAVLASLGCGNMVQVNTIASAAAEAVSINPKTVAITVGIITAGLLFLVLLGGAKRICSVASYIVPVMSVLYIAATLLVICKFSASLPTAIEKIFSQAFGFKQMAGGAVGFSLAQSMRVGMTRGVFSNEAGIGTAPMAYATANSKSPVTQGMLGVFEVFADTILICTLTALVVITSNIPIPYNNPTASGMAIAVKAFGTVLGESNAGTFLLVCTSLFAFTSMLGWSLYGACAARFLWKKGGERVFSYLFVAASFVGAIMKIEPVWRIGEGMNSLMAVPNLIMLAFLAPVVNAETENYLMYEKIAR